jgi:acrylyl-CoA reductase (NADPH)
MRALLTEAEGDGLVSRIKDVALDPAEGDVTVRIEWSTVNYKDALALSFKGRIMQKLPLIGGIDFAGVVAQSESPAYKVGDRVLVNGWGLSQTHNGGYAEEARVPASWLVPVPETFSTRDAMAIGTAGYTAMLSVLALERSGMTPGSGDVLVTGANGGVGSIAIALLAGLGYRVIASTGRLEQADYLTGLGAAEILDRTTLSAPGKPLGKERWAGAVDSIGSNTLVNVLAGIRYGGAVAACGLAQGLDLPGSVLPFILRGVTLHGIDSVNAPQAQRLVAWQRLAHDLDPDKLRATTSEIALADVPGMVGDLLAGKVRGRTVVRIG